MRKLILTLAATAFMGVAALFADVFRQKLV